MANRQRGGITIHPNLSSPRIPSSQTLKMLSSSISTASPALPRWRPAPQEPCSCPLQPHGPRVVQPVRLNRLPECKGRFLLLRRRPRTLRLGVCMAEMARVGSGPSLEVGVSGEGDAILGWAPVEAALNRMSKWLVAGSFAFAALWKHDAEIMWALMGAVVNTLLSSSVLKQMFYHERPAPALRFDPGMLSSHAQSIFYDAMFLVLHYSTGLGQIIWQ